MRFLGCICVIVVLCFSCKKSEDRRCLKSAGIDTIKVIHLDPFSELLLGSDLNFVLVQSNEEKVVVQGGKNLVNFVDVSIDDECLKITNRNNCNFLRSYKHQLTVEVHLKKIESVLFQGSKPLVCENQLICNDLFVRIEEGAGELNLDIDCDKLYCDVYKGWGNMVLTGNTDFLRLLARGNGFVDSYGLNVADSLHVISDTPRDIKINADAAILRSETSQNGDIWYIGLPQLIDHNQLGTGGLVDKN